MCVARGHHICLMMFFLDDFLKYLFDTCFMLIEISSSEVAWFVSIDFFLGLLGDKVLEIYCSFLIGLSNIDMVWVF